MRCRPRQTRPTLPDFIPGIVIAIPRRNFDDALSRSDSSLGGDAVHRTLTSIRATDCVDRHSTKGKRSLNGVQILRAILYCGEFFPSTQEAA